MRTSPRTTELIVVPLIVAVFSAGRAHAESAPVTTEGGSFSVRVDFHPEHLYAGNGSADLDVLVSTVSPATLPTLQNATCDDGFMTVGKKVPEEVIQSAGVTQQRYLLTIGLRPTAEPRTHDVVLEFSRPGEPNPLHAYLKLPVGVVSSGQLTATIEGEAIDVGLVHGEHQFNVQLNNGSSEYDAYISQIELSATPDYLVNLASVKDAKVAAGIATLDPPFVVRARTRASLPLSLRVSAPDLSGALRGVSDPRAHLRFTYNDGHGRQISDLKIDKTVNVPVAVGYALAAVIIGLLLGLTIAGVARDARSVRATLATVASALLLIASVVTGHLQFSIFAAKWDYGSAVTLLVLSAAAVLGGAPYLRKWLGLAGTPPPAPPKVPGAIVLLLAVGASLLAAENRVCAQPAALKVAAARKTAPSRAQAKSLTPEELVQRGAFFLDAGNLEEAEKNLSAAADGGLAAQAERALYLLGTLEQRRYYAKKEQIGQSSWASLYRAEMAYGRARSKSSAETGWAYLADSAFNLALIQIERGATAQVTAAIKAVDDAAAKDQKVHVFQVVWSTVSNTVIDADFTTAFAAGALRAAIVADRTPGPWCFPGIIDALKDQKVAVTTASAAPKPLVSVAVPHAAAKEIESKGGTTYYDFSLSLSVPKERRAEIKAVDYIFDHSSFRKKRFTSADGANDFSVGYQGWGALQSVGIKILRTDGKEETMTFDMLADLGWE